MYNHKKYKERGIVMGLRTDLAIESSADFSEEGKVPGITKNVRKKAFEITEIIIESDEAGKPVNKPKGRYVTLEADRLSHLSDKYRKMTEELSDELKSFIKGRTNVLVAGLGNEDITPDALGPRIASGVMATRHIRSEGIDDEFLNGLNSVSVLRTGVLGNTGIETAEIIKAVTDRISPSLLIVIDALACSSLSRLGTTVQISDAGISPGSGVENKRKEISERTLGIPVIAVGVPTIVDVHTVVENVTGREADENMPNMMVTPKNIDSIIEHASRLVATSINMALQPSLGFDDAAEIAAG